MINGSSHLYSTGKVCDLREQENYICLTGIILPSVTKEDLKTMDTKFIKQRSDTWKTARVFARVTGSTCFDALGFSSLKKQREHFEYVFESKEKPEFSTEVRKLMKHGSDNEINAVATLVSKVLPDFLPRYSFFEEGCYIVFQENTLALLVSPDGIIRSASNPIDVQCPIPTYGLEIKCSCPCPGNVYKPLVYYDIPYYYVPQLLCEMAVLKTNSLIFVCYSSETSTVFEAFFDDELWDVLQSRMSELYTKDDSKCPKKHWENRLTVTEKLKNYGKEKVRFIAELPSVVAKECDHKPVATCDEDFEYSHNVHTNRLPRQNDNCIISDLHGLVNEMTESVKEAFNLCRHMASEVVLFLIADLDRAHVPEKQHAIPIAYAMKGYSLTTAIARKMLNDVLETCYNGGLYVPVVSFDGQCYQMAVRSANGDPLTILQLMKDVFKTAKGQKKSDFIRYIKQINCVHVETQAEAFSSITHRVDVMISW
ncbi:hypothetical protein KP79_PYT22905 [Mizuhopecten yessoensis]|uniref:Uncharacterized protein n=1 Tax=Mizuhopecten yessoensis TaxID=6573 RepID=A0A210QLR8_MIZYE|nr:hypothetical protein KP79_PYT22905 [Mizuhopecten yessoensis]